MTIPVAVTSRVLAPTIKPVLFVDGTVQLTGIVKEVGSTTVTVVSVPALMLGVKVPPLTLPMVTLSPVARPCGLTVVTRHGLLTSRQVV